MPDRVLLETVARALNESDGLSDGGPWQFWIPEAQAVLDALDLAGWEARIRLDAATQERMKLLRGFWLPVEKHRELVEQARREGAAGERDRILALFKTDAGWEAMCEAVQDGGIDNGRGRMEPGDYYQGVTDSVITQIEAAVRGEDG